MSKDAVRQGGDQQFHLGRRSTTDFGNGVRSRCSDEPEWASARTTIGEGMALDAISTLGLTGVQSAMLRATFGNHREC